MDLKDIGATRAVEIAPLSQPKENYVSKYFVINEVAYYYWVDSDDNIMSDSASVALVKQLLNLNSDNSDLQKANAQNMLSSVQQQQLNANIMQQNAQLKTNINQQNQLISQLMLEIATLKGGNK